MLKLSSYGIKSLTAVILLACLLTCTLCACGETEEESVVVIENETENSIYGLTAVIRGDIYLTKSISVTYMQLNEQAVSFPVGGKRVSKVYVHAGDSVKKGDILIELAQDNLQEQMDELEYRIAKNEILLKYLDSSEKFDEDSSYNSMVYSHPNIEEDDLKKLTKDQESIARNYKYKREDLNDDIEFDKKKLAYLKNEYSGSRIYSTMDGYVYTVVDGLEGSTSKKDEVVMTIVDNASGRFEAKDPEYAEYFHEGEPVEMQIVYGSAAGDYELIPYNMGAWGETQMFEIYSAPENEGIDVGTSGTIRLILEKKENVLTLPTGAVFHADGKPYVYVLDENNFRQLQWIETGLVGDNMIEITDGLNEGDKVVYQ